jgi:hypothetical protein
MNMDLGLQQLRGWPAGWTATLGGSRYDQLLVAIDRASTVEELIAIRAEAAAWQAAVVGRNPEAALQAADVTHRVSEKLARIAP